MRLKILGAVLLACCLPFGSCRAQAQSAPAASQPGLLSASEAGKILPTTVFFRGLSAPVQARNSGGIRFADKGLLLVSLVDTSGYSTQVKEKYQAYLITESAIDIDGHRLVPGAYGCGFIAGDTFVVQDIGAHDLFTAHTVRDTALRRPTPLQLVAAPGAEGEYRLYAGRSYVSLKVAVGK